MTGTMDKHLCAWILEFIVQQPNTECLTKSLLETLPVPEGNPRLQKLVLLRSIQEKISKNSISEKILEELDVIDQIHRNQGTGITESMKRAYCSVVLDCMVQACDKLRTRESRCLEKSTLRELVCENFGMRKEDIGTADWDLAKTRNCALTAVTGYLDEALAIMGPSFLESAVNDESLVKELELGDDGSRQKEQVLPMRLSETQKPVSPTEPRNVNDPTRNVNEPISLTEVQMVNEPIISNRDAQKVIEPGSFIDAEKVNEEMSSKESPKAQQTCICQPRHHKRPFRIIESEETVVEPPSSVHYSLQSFEVNKIREALKVSYQELKAVVTDPLPEALRVAEAVACEMAAKESNHETIVGSPSELAKDVPAQLVATDNEVLQSDEQDQGKQHPLNSKHIVLCVNAHGENPQTQEGDQGRKACNELRNMPRPSLMERNGTACAYEWDDPVASCSEDSSRSRIHLPTPKRKVVSPLKRDELMKFGRRKRKKWSLQEEEALREGVQTFGVGSWELILKSNPEAFEERTGVDLKDKWRNMTR